MALVRARLKTDGLKLVMQIEDMTGATTSAVVADLLDYLAIHHKDDALAFIQSDVVFNTRGFYFKRRPKDKIEKK